MCIRWPQYTRPEHLIDMAWTTRFRNAINAGLNLIGLELATTRGKQAETARLHALDARGHWSAPRFEAALGPDDPRFLDFLVSVCAPYQRDFMDLPREAGEGQDGFYIHNPWFGPVDAEVLYSVLRHFHPRIVVEVGSGFSTRLMRTAICDGKLRTRLCSIDPMPRIEIQHYADEQVLRRVEEIEPSELAHRLAPNDVLFIDSSHTVTTGGDVPYLFLEVLPRLEPGVLIHVHDIFLPFEYPREWVVDHRWPWNEQYLVQAMLYGSRMLEVLWPAHYMWMRHRHKVQEVIPSDANRTAPSSLWLRKLA